MLREAASGACGKQDRTGSAEMAGCVTWNAAEHGITIYVGYTISM